MKRTLLLASATSALALAALAHPAGATSITESLTGLAPNDGVTRNQPTFPSQDNNFVLSPGVQQSVVFESASDVTIPENGNGVTHATNFDQIAINTTGSDVGRYRFSVTENNANQVSGLVRFDTQTNTHTVIPGTANSFNQRLDLVRWTAWGTVIYADEALAPRAQTNPGDPNAKAGVVTEVINPLSANPTVITRPNVGSLAFEGYVQDSKGSIYYGDENTTGALYKFVPDNANANFDPANPDSSPLAKGSIYVLADASVPGDKNTASTGNWVLLKDSSGNLHSGVTTDPAVDAAKAAGELKSSGVNVTIFNRNEDMDIQTINGHEYFYVNPTAGNQTLSIEINAGGNTNQATIREFIGQDSIDAATGLPFGSTFLEPDNLAVSAFGDVCTVEDIGNSSANHNEPVDDLYCAQDTNGDGVADLIKRFGILDTDFAEPTGLIFDPLDPRIAYINVQHPADGTYDANGNFVPDQTKGPFDQTVKLTFTGVSLPEPGSVGLFGLALAGLARLRRRR